MKYYIPRSRIAHRMESLCAGNRRGVLKVGAGRLGLDGRRFLTWPLLGQR